MKTLQPLIAAHPFLADLAPEYLEILSEYTMARTFEDGAVIIEEGDTANRFYLVNSGNVRLFSRSRNAVEVEIEVLGAGDVLGWSWLFEPHKWQFTARAVGRTETLFFYATPLLTQLEENPEMGYEIMRRVAAITIRRLQQTREKLVNQAL